MEYLTFIILFLLVLLIFEILYILITLFSELWSYIHSGRRASLENAPNQVGDAGEDRVFRRSQAVIDPERRGENTDYVVDYDGPRPKLSDRKQAVEKYTASPIAHHRRDASDEIEDMPKDLLEGPSRRGKSEDPGRRVKYGDPISSPRNLHDSSNFRSPIERDKYGSPNVRATHQDPNTNFRVPHPKGYHDTQYPISSSQKDQIRDPKAKYDDSLDRDIYGRPIEKGKRKVSARKDTSLKFAEPSTHRLPRLSHTPTLKDTYEGPSKIENLDDTFPISKSRNKFEDSMEGDTFHDTIGRDTYEGQKFSTPLPVEMKHMYDDPVIEGDVYIDPDTKYADSILQPPGRDSQKEKPQDESYQSHKGRNPCGNKCLREAGTIKRVPRLKPCDPNCGRNTGATNTPFNNNSDRPYPNIEAAYEEEGGYFPAVSRVRSDGRIMMDNQNRAFSPSRDQEPRQSFASKKKDNNNLASLRNKESDNKSQPIKSKGRINNNNVDTPFPASSLPRAKKRSENNSKLHSVVPNERSDLDDDQYQMNIEVAPFPSSSLPRAKKRPENNSKLHSVLPNQRTEIDDDPYQRNSKLHSVPPNERTELDYDPYQGNSKLHSTPKNRIDLDDDQYQRNRQLHSTPKEPMEIDDEQYQMDSTLHSVLPNERNERDDDQYNPIQFSASRVEQNLDEPPKYPAKTEQLLGVTSLEYSEISLKNLRYQIQYMKQMQPKMNDIDQEFEMEMYTKAKNQYSNKDNKLQYNNKDEKPNKDRPPKQYNKKRILKKKEPIVYGPEGEALLNIRQQIFLDTDIGKNTDYMSKYGPELDRQLNEKCKNSTPDNKNIGVTKDYSEIDDKSYKDPTTDESLGLNRTFSKNSTYSTYRVTPYYSNINRDNLRENNKNIFANQIPRRNTGTNGPTPGTTNERSPTRYSHTSRSKQDILEQTKNTKLKVQESTSAIFKMKDKLPSNDRTRSRPQTPSRDTNTQLKFEQTKVKISKLKDRTSKLPQNKWEPSDRRSSTRLNENRSKGAVPKKKNDNNVVVPPTKNVLPDSRSNKQKYLDQKNGPWLRIKQSTGAIVRIKSAKREQQPVTKSKWEPLDQKSSTWLKDKQLSSGIPKMRTPSSNRIAQQLKDSMEEKNKALFEDIDAFSYIHALEKPQKPATRRDEIPSTSLATRERRYRERTPSPRRDERQEQASSNFWLKNKESTGVFIKTKERFSPSEIKNKYEPVEKKSSLWWKEKKSLSLGLKSPYTTEEASTSRSKPEALDDTHLWGQDKWTTATGSISKSSDERKSTTWLPERSSKQSFSNRVDNDNQSIKSRIRSEYGFHKASTKSVTSVARLKSKSHQSLLLESTLTNSVVSNDRLMKRLYNNYSSERETVDEQYLLPSTSGSKAKSSSRSRPHSSFPSPFGVESGKVTPKVSTKSVPSKSRYLYPSGAAPRNSSNFNSHSSKYKSQALSSKESCTKTCPGLLSSERTSYHQSKSRILPAESITRLEKPKSKSELERIRIRAKSKESGLTVKPAPSFPSYGMEHGAIKNTNSSLFFSEKSESIIARISSKHSYTTRDNQTATKKNSIAIEMLHSKSTMSFLGRTPNASTQPESSMKSSDTGTLVKQQSNKIEKKQSFKIRSYPSVSSGSFQPHEPFGSLKSKSILKLSTKSKLQISASSNNNSSKTLADKDDVAKGLNNNRGIQADLDVSLDGSKKSHPASVKIRIDSESSKYGFRVHKQIATSSSLGSGKKRSLYDMDSSSQIDKTLNSDRRHATTSTSHNNVNSDHEDHDQDEQENLVSTASLQKVPSSHPRKKIDSKHLTTYFNHIKGRDSKEGSQNYNMAQVKLVKSSGRKSESTTIKVQCKGSICKNNVAKLIKGTIPGNKIICINDKTKDGISNSGNNSNSIRTRSMPVEKAPSERKRSVTEKKHHCICQECPLSFIAQVTPRKEESAKHVSHSSKSSRAGCTGCSKRHYKTHGKRESEVHYMKPSFYLESGKIHPKTSSRKRRDDRNSIYVTRATSRTPPKGSISQGTEDEQPHIVFSADTESKMNYSVVSREESTSEFVNKWSYTTLYTMN